MTTFPTTRGGRRTRNEGRTTSYNSAQNANLNSFQLLLLVFYLHFGANTRRLSPWPQNKRQAGTYVSSRFLLGIPRRPFSPLSLPFCCCLFRVLLFSRICIGERFLNISWSLLGVLRPHRVHGEISICKRMNFYRDKIIIAMCRYEGKSPGIMHDNVIRVDDRMHFSEILEQKLNRSEMDK